MTDIKDIKSILYTEKTLNMQDRSIVVFKTSTNMTKNRLKVILKDFLKVDALKINSLRVKPKKMKFKGIVGHKSGYKKFYVQIPENANIGEIEA